MRAAHCECDQNAGEPMARELDVEFVSLTKRYGASVAVDAINYRFAAGTYACLLGPSGCFQAAGRSFPKRWKGNSPIYQA